MSSEKEEINGIDPKALKKEIKEELLKREILMGLDDDEIDLGELVGVLWKRIRMLVAIPVIVAVLSALYALSLPNYYKAQATIFVHSKGGGGGMSALLGSLPFGGGLGLGGGGSAEYLMVYLKSGVMATEIINRLGIATNPILIGAEPAKEPAFDDLLKLMSGIMSVTKDQDGLIVIAAETKSASLSAQITEAYIDLLAKFSKGPAKEKRRFIESQLAKVSKELEEAESKFKAFQDKNQLIAVDEQSKAVIEKLVKLQSERVESKISLDMQNSLLKSSGNVPELVKIEAQKVAEEAKQKGLGEAIAEVEKKLEGMPALVLDFTRLMRELKVKEKVFATLTEQHEMAKISEAEEGSQFEVIDRARAPERKSKPKRATMVILSFVTAAMLAIFLAFIMEYVEKRRRQDEKKAVKAV